MWCGPLSSSFGNWLWFRQGLAMHQKYSYCCVWGWWMGRNRPGSRGEKLYLRWPARYHFLRHGIWDPCRRSGLLCICQTRYKGMRGKLEVSKILSSKEGDAHREPVDFHVFGWYEWLLFVGVNMNWFDVIKSIHLIVCWGCGYGIENVEVDLGRLRCSRASLILSLKRQKGEEKVLWNHTEGFLENTVDGSDMLWFCEEVKGNGW